MNYVAHELGLVGNSLESSKLTTNKYLMRRRLKECDINVPEFKIYSQPAYERSDFGGLPLVVKPVDREGSIGVTLASSPVEVNNAIKGAIYNSFSSICIVEEYIGGTEISVESVSIEGTHHLVAITEKITTGPPHFIEIHHRQPSVISNELRIKAADLMQKALSALGISNGACHSEFIIKNDNEIIVTEIAGRMGGDLIGSDLVPLSSGIDYLKAVIEISLGSFKNLTVTDYNNKQFASVSYLTSPAGTVQDIYDYTNLYPEIIKSEILVEKWGQVPQKTEGSRSRVARAVYLTGNADYYLPINNVFNILVQ